MATQYEDYKFPHERDDKEELNVSVEEDDEELKVEIVDDTPPEDRLSNRCRKTSKTNLRK
jgi:hypothetical protein